MKVIVVLVLVVAVSQAQLLAPITNRTLSTGQVKGKIVRTENKKTGLAFLDIPYAKPPVGDLRFEPTVRPADTWNGTRNGTIYGHSCMSNSSKTTSPQSDISEDCLTVNVFTSVRCLIQDAIDGACPVIYYIHGGGFMYDAPKLYPESVIVDNFASKGIVFVTVGYRLGTFGFWQTAANTTAGAHGNYGLYDLLAGLEWVQDEIGVFGGDPAQVTIMGHSSGASTVSLLSMLPAAQGLFVRAIEMSGAMGTDSQYKPPLASSLRMAQELGCATKEQWTATDNDTWTDIVSCMRNVSATDIILTQRDVDDETPRNGPDFFSGPNVDGVLLPDYPSVLSRTRPTMVLMTGITANEYGSYSNADNKTDYKEIIYRKCVQEAIAFEQGQSRPDVQPHLQMVINRCYEYYASKGLEEGATEASNANSIVSTFSEVRSAQAANGTVYLYSFDYSKPNMTFGHAKDLTFVMGSHPFEFDANDTAIRDEYVNLFANFVKTGNPTPNVPASQQWKPVEKPLGYNYYSVDVPAGAMQPMFHYDDVNFWKSTVPAVEIGASYEDSQLGVTQRPLSEQVAALNLDNLSPDDLPEDGMPDAGDISVVKQGFDFRLAFYVTLAVVLLLLMAIVVFALIKMCRKVPSGTVNERTPLLASGKPGGQDNSGARNDVEETALFGASTTVPTDIEASGSSLAKIDEVSNENRSSTRGSTRHSTPLPPEPDQIPLHQLDSEVHGNEQPHNQPLLMKKSAVGSENQGIAVYDETRNSQAEPHVNEQQRSAEDTAQSEDQETAVHNETTQSQPEPHKQETPSQPEPNKDGKPPQSEPQKEETPIDADINESTTEQTNPTQVSQLSEETGTNADEEQRETTKPFVPEAENVVEKEEKSGDSKDESVTDGQTESKQFIDDKKQETQHEPDTPGNTEDKNDLEAELDPSAVPQSQHERIDDSHN